MRYFISDFHFGHARIIKWERTQFKTIEEHDNFLINKFSEWRKKLNREDEFWFLGDWGEIDYLYLLDDLKCKKIMVMGNHDPKENIHLYEEHFNIVYQYPVFISNKILVSHHPRICEDSVLCVSGHLHGMIVDKPNYICVSCNDVNYNLVSERSFQSHFTKMPKYTQHFLYEPYCNDLKVISKVRKQIADLILDENDMIDVSATRAYYKIKPQIEKIFIDD